MKIRELHCYPRTMKLSAPYSIAYESVDRCENVFMRLVTTEGMEGRGVAAPDRYVTGESLQDVMGCFETHIEPFLKGKDIFRYGWIMESLKKKAPGSPSALAMVDMALYDLLAQKAGVPLYKLLGGYRKSIPTSITIGIMPVEESLECAEKYLGQGFTILKVKGGRDVGQDIERINRIRERAGRKIRIRFDANQGYTLEDSLLFMKGTENSDIELFEQPTHKNDAGLLKQVTLQVPVPVMADESLMSLNDVFRLSRNGCTDLVNIKLMKTGGILEATHINSVARAAGIGAMVGCMDESALGIAAGLHFALSRPNILYADLDGHLDIMDDPFQRMVRIVKGVLYPPDAPGLGWGILKKPNFHIRAGMHFPGI